MAAGASSVSADTRAGWGAGVENNDYRKLKQVRASGVKTSTKTLRENIQVRTCRTRPSSLLVHASAGSIREFAILVHQILLGWKTCKFHENRRNPQPKANPNPSTELALATFSHSK